MAVNDEDDLLGLPGSEPSNNSVSKPRKQGLKTKAVPTYRKPDIGKGKVVGNEGLEVAPSEQPVEVPKPKKDKGVSPTVIYDPRAMSKKDLTQIVKEHKLVKDVFAETFMDLQYLDKFSLKTWAMENPTEFYRLSAKLIPVQLTGEGGGPLALKNVTFE